MYRKLVNVVINVVLWMELWKVKPVIGHEFFNDQELCKGPFDC